ncbi:MAG TPA: hypothetical protein VJ821_03445 [Anaerolineales bacterium]|nr:hypothetical protein [Anaerolineales bacterium]
MKKLIQISLIVILVCAVFQVMAGGSMVSASNVESSAPSIASFSADTSVQDVQMATCLAILKRVVCVMPNVGWNT